MVLYSIILAAEKGDKMKSAHAKAMQCAAGRPMIDWVLAASAESGAKESIVVTGYCAGEIEEHLAGGVTCIRAENDSVIGAIAAGLKLIDVSDGTVMILSGDTPLVTSDTLKSAYELHTAGNRACTAVGSIFLFDIKKLAEVIGGEAQEISELAEILQNSGEKCGTYTADKNEFLRVNDRIALSKADRTLNDRKITEVMESGVCVIDPDSVRIDGRVKIGRDTLIYPGTILEGDTEIGEECEIGPSTRIVGCKIGNGTAVQYSVALGSSIGEGTAVGPFAYIRPGSVIGNNIKVGDFVEVKNASIGDNTKIAHLTYVGDADVGERVNFGCGTVVVNYDGIKKHRTTIEDDCFIGCNSNLVSPVTVRKGAYTAAGSTITDEVPEEALAIARARQVNKDGWAARNRRKD